MSEFYISLPSNTQQDLKSSRRNTSSEFHVTLPTGIRLTGDWEVALVEIQHPYSWNTITDDMDKYGQQQNEIRIRNYRTRKTDSIFVKPGNYDNIDHMMAAIHPRTLLRVHRVNRGQARHHLARPVPHVPSVGDVDG